MCAAGGSAQDWFTAGIEDSARGRLRVRTAVAALLTPLVDARRHRVVYDPQSRSWLVRQATGRCTRHTSLDGLIDHFLSDRSLQEEAVIRMLAAHTSSERIPEDRRTTTAVQLDDTGWAAFGIWISSRRRDPPASGAHERYRVVTPGGRLSVWHDGEAVHSAADLARDAPQGSELTIRS